MTETSPIQAPTVEGEQAIAVLRAMKERKLGQLQGRSDTYSTTAWNEQMYAISLLILALASAPTAVGFTFALAATGTASLSLYHTFQAHSINKEAKKYAEKEGLDLKAEELK
ncbi:MAG: hypothetical protein V4449_02445 [Patescibacteria group bacterium]